YAVLETSRIVAVLLAPLLPELSSRMLQQLGQPELDCGSGCHIDPQLWPSTLAWGGLKPGLALPEPTPVMQRLELDSPL
ncbi:MAG: methionine--tRNA ligase, partial [Cyanobacteriota bacterium]